MILNKYDYLWIDLALRVAELSKDPKTKVGAVLVSKDNRNLSIGYNGFAKGFPDIDKYWLDRELKHSIVIHAEENALAQCTFIKDNAKIYVTHQPCNKCLTLLVNNGIKDIFYLYDYTTNRNMDIYNDLILHCNINIHKINI